MVDFLYISCFLLFGIPPHWREGLIVNLFKKGEKEDPCNYRGITLLSVVGKVREDKTTYAFFLESL